MTDAAVEIKSGLERLDVEFIYELLRQTHWARNRPREVFERAIGARNNMVMELLVKPAETQIPYAIRGNSHNHSLIVIVT